MIGKTISHYKILEKLGEGGMGVVYKSEDTKLERTVAIKFLPSELTRDEEAKKRFVHEAQAASALEHNNICNIHEIDQTEDGQLFVVMACYEGENLKEKIDQGPLKIEEAVDIAIQISQGLTKAHERGIIHRDIKPSNIFITTDGIVKIIDFGLAKLTGKTVLTKESSTLGTVNFMSPEQVKGESIDRRTDIWSLGVVIYEMITGRQPFKGDYDQAVFYSIINEEPDALTGIRSGVPFELERIVNKAISKNPDERYQHADEILADLRKERKNMEYAGTGYVKTSSNIQQSQEIKVREKKNILRIIIPILILTVLAVILIIFNPFKNQTEQNPLIETPTKSLAVMYFEDIPDPEDKDHIGDMLTNLLTTSLSQLKGIEIISRERLLEIQKDMGQANAKSLSPSFAEQVASRAGITTMLIGSILQKKPTLAVTTQLIDVKSGRIISSNKVTNFSANQIFGLVDTLAYLLRNNFRTTGGSPREIKPVEEVTTKSPEAYRAYIEGVDLSNRFYYKESIAEFKLAIELDSNFAMAYYYLSMVRYFGKIETDLWQKPLQKAVELSGKVTDRERLEILAGNNYLHQEPAKAANIFNRVIERYPHETSPLDFLYVIYTRDLFEPEQYIEKVHNSLKINSSSKILWNDLAYTLASLNRRQDAFDAINKYISLSLTEPNPYDSKGDLYVWFDEYDSSRVLYQKALSFRKDYPSATKLGYYSVLRQQYKDAEKYFGMTGYQLPIIDIYRGQFHAALKKFKLLMSSHMSSDIQLQVLVEMMHLYYETGQYKEMLFLKKQISTELKRDPPNKIYGTDYTAWALAENGKFSKAHRLLDSIQIDAAERTPRMQANVDYSLAFLLLEEGKNELAMKQFKKANDLLPPNHEPNIFYSISLIKCGQLSKAVRELQRLIYWPGNRESYILPGIPGALGYWPIPAVKAHYWLGVAYEKQGEKIKALNEYKKFLHIWKDADFNSPELKDAKMRVSKLMGVALK